MTECKYATKRDSSARFMAALPDGELQHRRAQHEAERATAMGLELGSFERGSRLIWMRAVRREIAKRLGT